jgi:hypothetical protein
MGILSRRSLVSPVAAIVLALCAVPSLAYVNVIWNPGYYGDFGIDTHPPIVGGVVAGSPADKAGIKAGDTVERPRTMRERLLLSQFVLAPHPGENLTVSTVRNARSHRITLKARALPPLSATDRLLLGVKCGWLFVFLAVALALVLLRPKIMTWAFYLFALNLVFIIGPPELVLSYAPVGWSVTAEIAHDLIAPAGVAGFVVFCARFPANAAVHWRRIIELVALCAAAIIAAWLLYEDCSFWFFVPLGPIASTPYYVSSLFLLVYMLGALALLKTFSAANTVERQEIRWVCAFLAVAMIGEAYNIVLKVSELDEEWSFLSIFILGGLVFAITYARARGLERHRIKWVALGFSCALAATVLDFLLSFGPTHASYIGALEVLYVALPISVAYAVIRHRVIDVRLVVGRALALGIIAAIVATIALVMDWLFSTWLPNSRFEAAIYAGLALMIGFSLNAGRQRIGKAVDSVFFRQRYYAHEQANSIADTIAHAASKTELYEPLTTGISKAFCIASIALFERVEDGGFVRVAACGWLTGMTWHILPDDPLALRANGSTRVLDIDALRWQEKELPAGVARPTTLFPIISMKRVAAILLCGAHENGTALDSDEIRTIRRSCTDAGFLYGAPSTAAAGALATIDLEQPTVIA